MYICMYVYAYVYIYVCIYICIYVYIYTYIYTCIFKSAGAIFLKSKNSFRQYRVAKTHKMPYL